jgi:hypothetical protein
MLEELYWTSYYIWINPTAWSLVVVFVLCAVLGYSLGVATCGWWQIIGLCLASIFMVGMTIFTIINLIQMFCGISPRFLSEFDYIAQASWIDNVFFGLMGLVVGSVADIVILIRD